MCTPPKRILPRVALVLALATAPVAGQTKDAAARDLVLGTWILDLEASSYSPGPAPKRQTRIYAAAPEGIKTTITGVDGNGREWSAEYVADYDSLEYPISGTRARVSAIALKRINAHTAEAILKHAQKVIGTARRVIAEDGQTMTITYEGEGPNGEDVRITAVFERADDS